MAQKLMYNSYIDENRGHEDYRAGLRRREVKRGTKRGKYQRVVQRHFAARMALADLAMGELKLSSTLPRSGVCTNLSRTDVRKQWAGTVLISKACCWRDVICQFVSNKSDTCQAFCFQRNDRKEDT